MWTRIWWVRPVSRLHRQQGVAGEALQDPVVGQAGRPQRPPPCGSRWVGADRGRPPPRRRPGAHHQGAVLPVTLRSWSCSTRDWWAGRVLATTRSPWCPCPGDGRCRPGAATASSGAWCSRAFLQGPAPDCPRRGAPPAPPACRTTSRCLVLVDQGQGNVLWSSLGGRLQPRASSRRRLPPQTRSRRAAGAPSTAPAPRRSTAASGCGRTPARARPGPGPGATRPAGSTPRSRWPRPDRSALRRRASAPRLAPGGVGVYCRYFFAAQAHMHPIHITSHPAGLAIMARRLRLFGKEFDETVGWSASKLYARRPRRLDSGNYARAIELLREARGALPLRALRHAGAARRGLRPLQGGGARRGDRRSGPLHQALPPEPLRGLCVLSEGHRQLQPQRRLPGPLHPHGPLPARPRGGPGRLQPTSPSWCSASRTASTRRMPASACSFCATTSPGTR
jgi:hypothetical protein